MKLFSKITLEHIDACFVFMSTLSWVCVVFYTVHQETQSKHVSKSDFGFGKMENLEPINFPIPVIWFTGSMRTEFHHVVVFSLKKIPISHHFFFLNELYTNGIDCNNVRPYVRPCSPQSRRNLIGKFWHTHK